MINLTKELKEICNGYSHPLNATICAMVGAYIKENELQEGQGCLIVGISEKGCVEFYAEKEPSPEMTKQEQKLTSQKTAQQNGLNYGSFLE